MKIWQTWLTHCCTWWMPKDNYSKWKLKTSTTAPSHGVITPTFLTQLYQKAVSGQCHDMAILPQRNRWMGPQPVWTWQWRENTFPEWNPNSPVVQPTAYIDLTTQYMKQQVCSQTYTIKHGEYKWNAEMNHSGLSPNLLPTSFNGLHAYFSNLLHSLKSPHSTFHPVASKHTLRSSGIVKVCDKQRGMPCFRHLWSASSPAEITYKQRRQLMIHWDCRQFPWTDQLHTYLQLLCLSSSVLASSHLAGLFTLFTQLLVVLTFTATSVLGWVRGQRGEGVAVIYNSQQKIGVHWVLNTFCELQ